MQTPPNLRNQKLSLRRISSKYPRKLVGNLTPKIFRLSVSHRKFHANNFEEWGGNCFEVWGRYFIGTALLVGLYKI